MERENSLENGAKIFCVYFHNLEQRYDFGKIKGQSSEILNQIAKIGGTKQFYDSDTLQGLCKTFDIINEAIETDYGLRFIKKNENKVYKNHVVKCFKNN